MKLKKVGGETSGLTIRQVVQEKICVGCGACAVATTNRITVLPTSHGYFQARLQDTAMDDLHKGSAVCPFTDEAPDEDALAESFLPPNDGYDKRVGRYLSIYAGRVAHSEDLTRSSSGGMTTWMALELLRRGLVDGVVHVRAGEAPELFQYCLSYDAAALRDGRKSQYYSTSMAEVLQTLRGDGRRYAFIGVPCFVKAMRLLCREDETLRTQMVFCIGLVCGHLKSSGFAELLAWQLGIPPSELAAVDFRVKVPGKAANHYDFGARDSKGGEMLTRPTNSLLGGNWGHAMFQLKACDYCDDIFAETADIAFGDAWLSQYTPEWRGTNVVINRHPVLQKIIEESLRTGELELDTLAPEQAAASQEANYRHRWDGLSVRLQDDAAKGRWSPRKRIAPGSRLVSKQRRKIVRLRQKLAGLSHKAFAEAKAAHSLEHYFRAVNPLVKAMNKAYRRPERPLLHLYWRVHRMLDHLLRKVGLRGAPLAK